MLDVTPPENMYARYRKAHFTSPQFEGADDLPTVMKHERINRVSVLLERVSED